MVKESMYEMKRKEFLDEYDNHENEDYMLPTNLKYVKYSLQEGRGIKRTLTGILNNEGGSKFLMGSYIVGRTLLPWGILGTKYLVTGDYSTSEGEWALVLGLPASVLELATFSGISAVLSEKLSYEDV